MFNTLKLFIILSALSLVLCSCSSNKNNKNFISSSVNNTNAAGHTNLISKSPDMGVQKFLGLRCLEIINNPEKVEVYQIARSGKPNQKGNSIQGYPVVQKGQDLDNKEIKAVTKIINTSSSYDFKWSKRIRIRPTHALRFIGHSEKVDIVIDFNTRQWTFFHDKKIMPEDISKPAVTELRHIILKLF